MCTGRAARQLRWSRRECTGRCMATSAQRCYRRPQPRQPPRPLPRGESEAPLAVTLTLGPWDVTARSYPSPSSSSADSGWRLRPTGEGQQRRQICLYTGQVRQGSSMCQLAPPGADGRAPPPQPQP